MKNFIENVVALFKEKYDSKSNEVKKHLIDLPPDIRPSTGVQISHNDQNRTNRHHDNGINKNSFDDNHVDSDDLDDVDSLATFILSSERSKEYSTSSNHTKGRWVTKYESITIHNRTIERGFFILVDSLML